MNTYHPLQSPHLPDNPSTDYCTPRATYRTRPPLYNHHTTPPHLLRPLCLPTELLSPSLNPHFDPVAALALIPLPIPHNKPNPLNPSTPTTTSPSNPSTPPLHPSKQRHAATPTHDNASLSEGTKQQRKVGLESGNLQSTSPFRVKSA